MSCVKKACVCSLCAALCFVLPPAFHGLALGAAFSPMHLPVLLCGLVCGWPYGLFCGFAGPVISTVLSGMPSPIQLIYMIPELCVYGLAAGLLFARLRTGRLFPDVWLSAACAMLAGRIVGGAVQAVFYLSTARAWSAALWAGTYLAGTAPGAVFHLAALPVLTAALMRARLIPARYPEMGLREETAV